MKSGVAVLNSPGTIDAGYRGEIGVILINHSNEILHVEKHMKIAQMVIQKLPEVELVETNLELDVSDRGEEGFGSTGLK
ncbi:dUTP diphosphatase [Viridibacillus sp. NPDC093762]|uniref:dUTP diphosphatase n=1 Tax=Viridibacillus sp. NPDC093762 TaxID=3390720 RepID=UPI003D063831